MDKRTLSFVRSLSWFVTFFIAFTLTSPPRLLGTASVDVNSSASGSGVSSESGYNVADQTRSGSGQESLSQSRHPNSSSGEASTLRQTNSSASLVTSFCEDPHQQEWTGEKGTFPATPQGGCKFCVCKSLCDLLRSSKVTCPAFPNSTTARSLSSFRDSLTEAMGFLLRFNKWSRLWQGHSTTSLSSVKNTSKVLGDWGFVVNQAERLTMIMESCEREFNWTCECTATQDRGTCHDLWKTLSSPGIAFATGNATNAKGRKSPSSAGYRYISTTVSDELEILLSIGNVSSRLVENHLSTHNERLLCDFGLFSSRVVNLLRFIEDVVQLVILRNRFKAWQGEKQPCQLMNVSRYSASNHTLDLTSSLVQDLLTRTFCNTTRKLDLRKECDDIQGVIGYLKQLPFLLENQKNRLTSAHSLVCAREVALTLQDRERQTEGTFSREYQVEGCKTDICMNYVDCPLTYFVKSNDWGTSGPSFSPELFHQAFLRDTLGVVFLHLNGTPSSTRWCRPACRLEQVERIGGLENILFPVDLTLVLLFFFALYLIVFSKENRIRMLSDPRRFYFYLNIYNVFTQVTFRLGVYLPFEGYWCGVDGSLVTSVEEAGVACKIAGSLYLYSRCLRMLLVSWMAISWYFIAGKLEEKAAASHRTIFFGKTAPEIVNGLFIAAILFLPILMVGLSLVYGTFISGLTGSSGLKFCLPVEALQSQFLLAANVCSLGGGSFVFLFLSCKFRRIKVSRQRSVVFTSIQAAGRADEEGKILGRWHRRHGFFLLLTVAPSIMSLAILAFPNAKSFFNGSLEEFSMYINCATSLSCKQNCKADVVPHFLSFPLIDMANAVFVILPSHFLSFAWFFFKEIEWPGLHRVRGWIKVTF